MKSLLDDKKFNWFVFLFSLMFIVLSIVGFGVLLSSTISVSNILISTVAAIVPAMILTCLVLFFDRLTFEPLWMLASSFAWGAVVATFTSIVLNTSLSFIFTSLSSEAIGHIFTTVLFAPIIEELSKSLILLLFILLVKDEINTIIDGIVYASLAGISFAMVENVVYYARTLEQNGIQEGVSLFFLRGFLSSFVHPLFTIMIGIGISLYVKYNKKLFIILGYVFAMTLHAIWNGSSLIGQNGFLTVYFFFFLPLLLFIIAIIVFEAIKESKMIRDNLFDLEEEDVDLACNHFKRVIKDLYILVFYGPKKFYHNIIYHHLLVKLAMCRKDNKNDEVDILKEKLTHYKREKI